MSVLLLLACVDQVRAWRAVSRWPALTLVVGPLNAVAGLLGDRSAFFYPSLVWVAIAAIAGGWRWAAACASMLTAATTAVALLTGASLRAAFVELLTTLPPRLLLAVALAGLAEGLAQIVWVRALAPTQRGAPGEHVFAADASGDHSPAAPSVRSSDVVLDAEEVGSSVDDDGYPSETSEASEARAAALYALTVPEKEVIARLADGLSLAQAADALGITYRAARARIERARARIDANTTPELVQWAVQHGCVPRPRPREDPG